MSQDFSTTHGVREPFIPPNQPWSPEAEADKLMDELFGDIDRILEGGNKLPTEPAKPEYISLEPIAIPQLTQPSVVRQPQDLPQQPSNELAETASVEPPETSVAPTTPPPENRSGWWSLEKVLLIAGLTSIGVTILLLLMNQHKLHWPWSPNPDDSPSTQTSQLSASDAQFVAYMLRSLEVIDHKTKTKQQLTPSPTPLGTTNLQSIPAPNNRSLVPNQAPTVLEKVYIPVYPPQTTGVPSAARPPVTVAPLPARPLVTVAPPSVARPAVPLPPPPAKPSAQTSLGSVSRLAQTLSAAASRLVPAPSTAARRSVPASSVATRPTVPSTSPPPAVTQPSEIPQLSASVGRHTLVGLLELGDHSAALFEINGVTQRINIGESIGASGWTLVSVANQEAVVRRNGEVRSVYVGQKF